MSSRQRYHQQLGRIAELSRESYYRRMSFLEAKQWLSAYNDLIGQGYPHDEAMQRAWDCHFAARRGRVLYGREVLPC